MPYREELDFHLDALQSSLDNLRRVAAYANPDKPLPGGQPPLPPPDPPQVPA